MIHCLEDIQIVSLEPNESFQSPLVVFFFVMQFLCTDYRIGLCNMFLNRVCMLVALDKSEVRVLG